MSRMDYTCRDTIIQNMKDFGCDEVTIQAFLGCFDRGDRAGQKRILQAYREKIMSDLHEKQKQVDLLDFMVYQLEKCHCGGQQ